LSWFESMRGSHEQATARRMAALSKRQRVERAIFL